MEIVARNILAFVYYTMSSMVNTLNQAIDGDPEITVLHLCAYMEGSLEDGPLKRRIEEQRKEINSDIAKWFRRMEHLWTPQMPAPNWNLMAPDPSTPNGAPDHAHHSETADATQRTCDQSASSWMKYVAQLRAFLTGGESKRSNGITFQDRLLHLAGQNVGDAKLRAICREQSEKDSDASRWWRYMLTRVRRKPLQK